MGVDNTPIKSNAIVNVIAVSNLSGEGTLDKEIDTDRYKIHYPPPSSENTLEFVKQFNPKDSVVAIDIDNYEYEATIALLNELNPDGDKTELIAIALAEEMSEKTSELLKAGAWRILPPTFKLRDLDFAVQSGFEQISIEKRFERYKQAVNAIANTITSSLHLEIVFSAIADYIIKILKADGSLVLLIDHGKDEIIERAFQGYDSDHFRRLTYQELIRGYTGKVIRTETTQVTENAQAENSVNIGEARESAERNNTGPVLVVPIIIDGEVEGTLTATRKLIDSREPFSEDDIEIMEILTAYASGAIKNARLFRQIKIIDNHQQQLLRALYSLTSQRADTILQRFVDYVYDKYEEASWVCVVFEKDYSPILASSTAPNYEEVISKLKIRENGFTTQIIKKGIIFPDDFIEKSFSDPKLKYNDIVKELGIQSLLGMPISEKNKYVGAIWIAFTFDFDVSRIKEKIRHEAEDIGQLYNLVKLIEEKLFTQQPNWQQISQEDMNISRLNDLSIYEKNIVDDIKTIYKKVIQIELGLHRGEITLQEAQSQGILDTLKDILFKQLTLIRTIAQCNIAVLYSYDPYREEIDHPPIYVGDVRNPKGIDRLGKVRRDSIVYEMLKLDTNFPIPNINEISEENLRKKFLKSHFVEDEKIKSLIVIPLHTNNKAFGVLFLNYRKLDVFDNSIVKPIVSLNDFMCFAIGKFYSYYYNIRRQKSSPINQHSNNEMIRQIIKEIEVNNKQNTWIFRGSIFFSIIGLALLIVSAIFSISVIALVAIFIEAIAVAMFLYLDSKQKVAR